MSLTIQQIILDAKRLASRLKDHDVTADSVMSQAQCVYKQIDAMKQYQEEVAELNDSARQRPHTILVAGIQQENRHLRELQQENRELRTSLEEHQNALELVMSKYRQQMSQLIANSKLDITSLHNENYAKLIGVQSDKINEMAAVMSHAAGLDEKKAFEDKELMARLKTENKLDKSEGSATVDGTLQHSDSGAALGLVKLKLDRAGLREMLEISVKFGSISLPPSADGDATELNCTVIENKAFAPKTEPLS